MAIKKLISDFKQYMNDMDWDGFEDTVAAIETASVMAQTEPLFIDDDDLRDALEEYTKYELWLYQDNLYGIGGSHSKEHQRLLILETADQDRQKFERLKAKFSTQQAKEIKYERERIPEDVRIAVWRRDQGKCVSCGSRERLEYDHIVPVTRGGGNTSRNVELLCETCNRAKGNRIQ